MGWANYAELLKSDMITYGKNTLILWVIGFIPQIVVALVLANWFTDARLKIHKLQFFKVVIYLPNLIMASAFALLFFTLFSNSGPVNSILQSMGVISKPIDFMGSVFGTRSLIGFMNFLMWFVIRLLCSWQQSWVSVQKYLRRQILMDVMHCRDSSI